MPKLIFLPNLISLLRIALVPVFILALKDGDYSLALTVFIAAGVSDALDGLAAKRFGLQTQLGAILDPAADKILLISAYVMLMLLGHLPFWLMLTVVFRDLLIIGGYVVCTSLVGPVRMQPSALSKLNTFMQISLIGVILVQQAAGTAIAGLSETLVVVVLVTTVTSGVHYLWIWGVMKDIRPVAPGAAGDASPRD